jgi:large subunit ribosomal protein L27
MAHKLGAGSTRNKKDSHSKRLGLKINHNQYIKKGSILVRQRGNIFKAGINVGCGRDYTLYALKNGFVYFTVLKKIDIL